jgi:hypothetical protein
MLLRERLPKIFTKRIAFGVLIRIGATMAMLCLFAEVLLRVVLGLGSPVLFLTDTRFGYFPRGDQHLRRFFVAIDTNHYGMRSAAIPEKKGAKDFRILFVGDSVPFGTTYVGQRDIFVQRIAAQLGNRREAQVSVMNASAPGWAPGNELGFLQARGTYDADVVVLVYNTKDLSQPFSVYKQSPLIPLRNPPLALVELWSRYLKPRILSESDLVDPGSTSNEGGPSATIEQSVLQTVDLTRQLVESRSARFAILLIPAFTSDVVLHQFEWDQGVRQLKRLAAQEDIPILDLTRDLSATDAASLYFDGIHLRQAGNEFVASKFVSWFNEEWPTL